MRWAVASQASMLGNLAPRRPPRPRLRTVAAAAETPPGQLQRGHGARGAEGWKGENSAGRGSYAAAEWHPGCLLSPLFGNFIPPVAAAGWDLSKHKLDSELLITYGEMVQVLARAASPVPAP